MVRIYRRRELPSELRRRLDSLRDDQSETAGEQPSVAVVSSESDLKSAMDLLKKQQVLTLVWSPEPTESRTLETTGSSMTEELTGDALVQSRQAAIRAFFEHADAVTNSAATKRLAAERPDIQLSREDLWDRDANR